MTRALYCALPMAAMLAGCTSNPEQSIYVMQAATTVRAEPQSAPGGLSLKLRQVILPDYLDTTDLLTRIGQYKIEASRTGRWGERLSEGVTRTLAADLGRRLQANVVESGPIQPPSVQIKVAISVFDVTMATSVLDANWTMSWQGSGTSPDDGREPITRHGTFTASVDAPGGDLAVVAAMADTVSQLSDSIAATARAEASDRARLALNDVHKPSR